MYRAGTDADCLGHHRRRPMGDLTRRIAQRLRHRLLVQRSRQRRDARSSGLVVQQPVDPLRHETLLPAPYGDLALAGLPHDRVGPDAICRQQHDACAPHMLLSAVPIRDDRLQMRTIGAAHFNRDPLAHARSPCLAEHTLVRDSYVRFNTLERPRSGFPTTGVDIFVEADCETHATVADLLSPAVVSWRKILSFSILA